MLTHLRKINPEEARVADKKRKHNEYSGTDIPGTSGTNYEPPAKQRTTIESILAKKKIWDINDHRSQEIHYLRGEMIAVDIAQYSLTSDIGFNMLIAKLCPNYSIPSKKFFTENNNSRYIYKSKNKNSIVTFGQLVQIMLPF